MEINFKELSLQNFKSHQDIAVNFGERTDITGDNAKGKSSIMEAITFTLYGTNSFNSKMNPTPITYQADETTVALLLNADAKDLLLARSLKKGKAAYYINEVPSKATEFNSLVEQLFDKELFFSLFNPSYFFTLQWEQQRAMLLKYIQSPISKEILKHMPDGQASCLKDLLKKNALADIEKIHKENKVKYDKQYIQAQTKTKTLQDQLSRVQGPSAPLDSLNVEISQLKKQRDEIEKVTDSAGDNNGRINVLQNQINQLLQQRDQMQANWAVLKEEQIEGSCRVCKQPLQDGSLQAAEDEKNLRIEKFKADFKAIVTKRTNLQEELSKLEYIDVSEQLTKVKAIQEQINSLEQDIRMHSHYQYLQQQVEEADKAESETHKLLKESIFILDSIKAFKAKEAELQAEKVQALFTTLSVRLFKQNKGDGEIKPDFEIEMDGKPYRALSLSESIRAGLELREVLSKQSELVMPVFVDNAESITKFKEPSGQLIVSRVIANQELKIEGAVAK